MGNAHSEAGKALIKEVLKHPGKNIKELFLKYDKNGNGTLDLDEFKLFFKDLLSVFLSKGFKQTGGGIVDEIPDATFEAVDTDKDGTISLEEFGQFINSMAMAYGFASMMSNPQECKQM